MNKRFHMTALAALLALAVLPCCTSHKGMGPGHKYRSADEWERASRSQTKAYSFEDFIAKPDYTLSRDIWCGAALKDYAPADTYVVVLLKEQRGRLYIHGEVAMDFPVCSGRVGGKETPRGTFRVSEMKEFYRSHSYGSYMDANNNFVQGNAVAGVPGPAGTHFEGADMPYWMRFNGGVGMHVGNVHRVGQSHGCVRVPKEACQIVYSKMGIGSKVIVK